MFVSFFPQPKPFIVSAIVWSILLVVVWFLGGEHLGTLLGMPPIDAETAPISPMRFLMPGFIWFYLYFFGGIAVFYLFWAWYAPHPWQNWSILGSGLILFATNFSVQVSIALNAWRGSFYDLIQKALTPPPGSVTPYELYVGVGQFLSLALVGITVAVLNLFLVRHYVFRWRAAMHGYFTMHWPRLRYIEGASQRVQDDTMRFSRTMEGLGVDLVSSVMTLIAFLPLLAALSVHVPALPLVGPIPYPLVLAAIVWSLFGTFLLAVVGVKLPGLEFKNQRVEAALRKELVYGEDDETRAQPPTLADLFLNVRKNYFTLYAHYVYFDVTRYLYLQSDSVFATLILVPTIAAGRITFGLFQQIVSAFSQVANSFQYLVNSWPTIVELISIYKRLRAFEATLQGEPLPKIDEHYLKREQAGVRPEDQPAS